MMSSKIDRRKFMILTGTSVAGLGAFQEAVPPEAPEGGSADVPRIMSLFSFNGGIYYFDPAGLYVEVGQTVEWVGVGFRSAKAYHPSHDNHELRIPENAEPFDSRVGGSGGTFRYTFQEEGTYDYYSPSHEYLGMVGRIVAGRPGGPAENRPGYGNRQGRQVMYKDASRLFEYLSPEKIVREKVVPYPKELLRKPFPWR